MNMETFRRQPYLQTLAILARLRRGGDSVSGRDVGVDSPAETKDHKATQQNNNTATLDRSCFGVVRL
jgi:hypothetical protein